MNKIFRRIIDFLVCLVPVDVDLHLKLQDLLARQTKTQVQGIFSEYMDGIKNSKLE